MILKRCEAAEERVNKDFLDRYSFRVDGNLTTLRAEMADVLAALQKIDISVSVALGTDPQGVLTELERFRGRDSPPSLESTQCPDLLEPIFKLLQLRTESGSKTNFYKVRAHRGLTLNEIADQQADKGHTGDAWLGEVRGREMEDALLFTKLDQKGVVSTRKGEHLLPWT